MILGGTTTNKGKRHPTVGNGVIIGTGAKVMGNIKIGDCSKIGSGAVVLKDVPPNSTCVGVPGRIVKRNEKPSKKVDLEHGKLPDPIYDLIQDLFKHQEENNQKIKILSEKNEMSIIKDINKGDE